MYYLIYHLKYFLKMFVYFKYTSFLYVVVNIIIQSLSWKNSNILFKIYSCAYDINSSFTRHILCHLDTITKPLVELQDRNWFSLRFKSPSLGLEVANWSISLQVPTYVRNQIAWNSWIHVAYIIGWVLTTNNNRAYLKEN